MDFPGSLNNPSFFKPQITFQGFFYTESILQSFFNIYKETHWVYKKMEMTDEKQENPLLLFFLKSNALFESEGHEGS